jgi:hypothetical protein
LKLLLAKKLLFSAIRRRKTLVGIFFNFEI